MPHEETVEASTLALIRRLMADEQPQQSQKQGRRRIR